MKAMKIFKIRNAGALAAGIAGLVLLAQPARLQAQATAMIHGHVQNPAGQAVTQGEVRLSTDKNPSLPSAKFEYSFPVDGNGDYKGTVDKPGNYIAVFFQQGHSVDFMRAPLVAGQDIKVDFDMTRPEFISKMTPADREALEAYKKQQAAVTAANAKIENLNKLLTDARTATKAGNYDQAVKDMTDATTAKPDEAILWDTLGDAQFGLANAAFKTARASKTTDPTLADKFQAAITSYQKAISLNAALAKPSSDLAGAADNQLGQAFGELALSGQPDKMKDASDAYEAAAKADPTKAGMYYFNEAATLFNASDMDGAAAAAQKAITADPTKVEAYYILGQSLIQKATVDPKTNVITAPPECIAAYQKYLELAPNGPHAEEIKGILQGIGVKVQTNYKAPGKK